MQILLVEADRALAQVVSYLAREAGVIFGVAS